MKHDIEEYIDNLQLGYDGEFKQNGEYIVTLPTSDDFSNVYNTIATNKELMIDDQSVSDKSKAKFIFFDAWYEIKLAANFDKDIFTLTVSER